MASKLNRIGKDIMSAMKSATEQGTSAYDTTAEVRRIEGDIAWVHIAGGVDETPVKLTVSAKAGDSVQVRVGGGRAWITGNASAPPTDDRQANIATEKAETAGKEIVIVREIADTAKKIAGDTDQYFWHTESGTDTGAHITEVTQDEFLADPANGGGNVLIRSNGIAIRKGLTELTEVDGDGLTVNDDTGAPVASFLESGSTVGKVADGQSRTITSGTGMRFVRRDGTTDEVLAHIGYGEGVAQSGTATAPYYTFGVRRTTTTAYNSSSTYSIGDMCVYDEKVYVCRYKITTPEPWTASHWIYFSGNYSHAEGVGTIASGHCSHAEGSGTTAIRNYSHAEGYNTTASGTYSHAEGVGTTALGSHSHVEGYNTTAIATYSHAEGSDTIASGSYSHAQNYGTIAAQMGQTAIGKYNIGDVSTVNQKAFIIGNGSSDTARSNALIVDWYGNLMTQGMAGMIQMFAGSTAPDGWLICNGQAVSRTDYDTLFSVIGTTYGSGNGSTTFNLPDMRGRFPLGSNSSYALNAKAGSTDAVVVSHTHSTAASGYFYMLSHGSLSGGDMGSQSGSGRHYPYQGNRSDGAYWGSQANTGAASSGVSGAGKNMPPYIGINFIIATGKTS